MAFTTQGLNTLLDSYYENRIDLELRAYDSGGTLLDSTSVTYSPPSSGNTDLESNATLTIASGNTVTSVELWDTSNGAVELANETISANFPDGGDLIVTSFELSVS